MSMSSIASSPDGEVLVTGAFGAFSSCSLRWGTNVIQSPGGKSGFVARLNASGSIMWAQSFGGSEGYDYTQGVAADSAGDVYVAGEFRYNATVGSAVNLTARGGGDMIFFKLDGASGAVVWVTQAGVPAPPA